MNDSEKKQKKIYRLDNAANLYPAIRNKNRPGVFRVSADLVEPVNPDTLQAALDITLKRIPGFSVKLRSGLFWHYFQHVDRKIVVQKDVSNPCTHMTEESTGGFLIRVRYNQNRIALESFHSITDGAGAMTFLKTLIAQYLNLSGIFISATNGVLNCKNSPLDDENSDQFPSFARKKPIRKVGKSRAFHVRGTNLPSDEMKIIKGKVPINALKHSAKNFNVTITEYLASIYLKVIHDYQLVHSIRLKLPIKLQIPVNLRKFQNTKTLRNFSAFVTPSIYPIHGEYTFLEIVELVQHYLRYETNKKHLQAQVAANLKYADNILIRLLPLAFKNNLILLGYKLMGPEYFTSTLSNLGMVRIPEEMKNHVKSFNFILGATNGTNISCAALGYQDDIHISFSRVIEETDIERRFFTFLVEHGIPVYVESYQER